MWGNGNIYTLLVTARGLCDSGRGCCGETRPKLLAPREWSSDVDQGVQGGAPRGGDTLTKR